MKPKTKLQMEIVNGSRKLAPVSEAQKRYALIEKCTVF